MDSTPGDITVRFEQPIATWRTGDTATFAPSPWLTGLIADGRVRVLDTPTEPAPDPAPRARRTRTTTTTTPDDVADA